MDLTQVLLPAAPLFLTHLVEDGVEYDKHDEDQGHRDDDLHSHLEGCNGGQVRDLIFSTEIDVES